MKKNEQPSSNKPEYKTITIRTSDGRTLQGMVNLTPNKRVSDLFTKSASPFIVIIDARSKEGEDKTLIVNKEHIVWVEPED